MKSKIIYDIAIIGAGLAGQVAACLLAQRGRRIAVIEPSPPSRVKAPGGKHIRTMAISQGSRDILHRAGIWRHAAGGACPIESIDVRDGQYPFILSLLKDDSGGETMGWIVDAQNLRKAGFSAMASFAGIEHIKASARDFSPAPGGQYMGVLLDDGLEIAARLVIGADGRSSRTRDYMDPALRRRDYHQRAIVCVVAHEHPHDNRATEYFWPEGPLAVLPMLGLGGYRNRSAVVLCEDARTRPSLMQADDETLAAAITARMPREYGAIKIIAPAASYPLTCVHAARYIAPRMALIADAAHGIHPIAGQGLNLGLQDAHALFVSLDTPAGRRDAGDAACLQAYEDLRRPAAMKMIAATEALNTFFSSRFAPFKLARRAGLHVLQKSPVLRAALTRYAMGRDA